jgi:hypothetical protein
MWQVPCPALTSFLPEFLQSPVAYFWRGDMPQQRRVPRPGVAWSWLGSSDCACRHLPLESLLTRPVQGKRVDRSQPRPNPAVSASTAPGPSEIDRIFGAGSRFYKADTGGEAARRPDSIFVCALITQEHAASTGSVPKVLRLLSLILGCCNVL